MKKRFVSALFVFVAALTMLFSMISTSAADLCTVNFFDEKNEEITMYAEGERVHLSVNFTAPNAGEARVATAFYGGDDLLKSLVMSDNIPMEAGKEITYESDIADTSGYEIISAFVLCDKDSIITATGTPEIKKGIRKFDIKLPNAKDYLYRAGNKSAVELGSLFLAVDGSQINAADVGVDVKDANGSVVTVDYKKNVTDWTKSTIDFNDDFTGFVKVTLTENSSCIPVVLKLEIVDAVNATTATNATSGNVVLLDNIGSGFTVSGSYAVYGNGFTLNYTGNGQYLNNGLKQGIVTVSENGILDNLRIKASIYPKAYMYYGTTLLGDYVQGGPSSVEGDRTRYHYQLSAIAAKGNATISNCYVYGGRTNIFVDTGDVTIKDTIMECGTVANVQIQSNASHAITFEDVTTIQYKVNSTVGDTSKVMLGAGVIVGPDTTENPKIVLKGDFKQYNWVTQEDANTVSDTKITKAIIEGAVNATAYNHTINGKNASNLGIIYMNTTYAEVENKTGLPYV